MPRQLSSQADIRSIFTAIEHSALIETAVRVVVAATFADTLQAEVARLRFVASSILIKFVPYFICVSTNTYVRSISSDWSALVHTVGLRVGFAAASVTALQAVVARLPIAASAILVDGTISFFTFAPINTNSSREISTLDYRAGIKTVIRVVAAAASITTRLAGVARHPIPKKTIYGGGIISFFTSFAPINTYSICEISTLDNRAGINTVIRVVAAAASIATRLAGVARHPIPKKIVPRVCQFD